MALLFTNDASVFPSTPWCLRVRRGKLRSKSVYCLRLGFRDEELSEELSAPHYIGSVSLSALSSDTEQCLLRILYTAETKY